MAHLHKVDIKDVRPYRECPKFETYSCNQCPLDPDIALRSSHPDDEKCKCYKSIRNRIGLLYPALLPMQGLTPREFNGKKNWEAKTPAQKEQVYLLGARNIDKLKSMSKEKGNPWPAVNTSIKG